MTTAADGAQWARRRTYAIISHPDAGKTTLTETLLLEAGAIRLAGQVRARGENRRTQSDWMKIEREKGERGGPHALQSRRGVLTSGLR